MRKRGTLHARRCGRRLTTHGRDVVHNVSNDGDNGKQPQPAVPMARDTGQEWARCGREAVFPSRVHCPPFPTGMPAHGRDAACSVSNDGDSTAARQHRHAGCRAGIQERGGAMAMARGDGGDGHRRNNANRRKRRKGGKNAAAESAFIPTCWRVGR